MLIDFNTPILDMDDEQIMDDTKTPSIPTDLARLAVTSLMVPFPDEQNLSGDDKASRFLLALRIKQSTKDMLPIDVTPEEVSLIKKLIAKGFGPLPVGRAFAILNQDSSNPGLLSAVVKKKNGKAIGVPNA